MSLVKSIKDKFNSLSLLSIAGLAAGFIAGGVIDFTFFHNHPLGKHLIAMVNEPFQQFYDFALNSVGFSKWTRDLTETASNVASNITPDAAALCTDPATFQPVPCG